MAHPYIDRLMVEAKNLQSEGFEIVELSGPNDPVGAPWKGSELDPGNEPAFDYKVEMAAIEADLVARKNAYEVKFRAHQLQEDILHLEHQLTIAVVEFEHRTGRIVDSVGTYERSSLPFEGYFTEANQGEFFSQRPGLKEAIKDRLLRVSVLLRKEEVG